MLAEIIGSLGKLSEQGRFDASSKEFRFALASYIKELQLLETGEKTRLMGLFRQGLKYKWLTYAIMLEADRVPIGIRLTSEYQTSEYRYSGHGYVKFHSIKNNRRHDKYIIESTRDVVVISDGSGKPIGNQFASATETTTFDRFDIDSLWDLRLTRLRGPVPLGVNDLHGKSDVLNRMAFFLHLASELQAYGFSRHFEEFFLGKPE